MIHTVLARKWRPQTFSDVIGQKDILMALQNSLLLNRLHHSYLLSGMRGVGKTTIARLIAKSLNCKIGITAYPCGKCNNCLDIEECCFVDLIEIDAASRTKVEDMRQLLDNVQYMPIRGRFKVYLIDEAHMLSKSSFNAMLKTLEEPPDHVKFLLATTEPQKVPITIISRCLQFHLKMLSIEQIYKRLCIIFKKENIITELNALKLIAKYSDGSMRDALSLSDKAIMMGNGKIILSKVQYMLGLLNIEHAIFLMELIFTSNSNKLMSQISKLSDIGVNWDNLLIDILYLLHKITIIKMLPNYYNAKEDNNIINKLKEISQNIDPSKIHIYYEILLEGRKELSFSPNPRIGVEMILLRTLSLNVYDLKNNKL